MRHGVLRHGLVIVASFALVIHGAGLSGATGVGSGNLSAEQAAGAVVKATAAESFQEIGLYQGRDFLTAHTAEGAVKLPRTTHGNVALASGANRLSIGLPDVAADASAQLENGAVVYSDPATPVDVAVQPLLEGGVRALVVVENATAPKRYRFPINGPTGSRLVLASELLGAEFDTGEVFLIGSSGELLAIIDPAWAKDAQGRAVPTRYEIEGRDLIQVVDFNENSAFPIVADPSVWKILKCAGALAAFIGGNLIAASKLLKVKRYIKELGGLRKSAKLLLMASTWEERLRIGGTALVGLAAELSGAGGAYKACRG